MDGFGYKNWQDDSYDSSTRSSDPYGFQEDNKSSTGGYGNKGFKPKKNAGGGGDGYDFDITGGDEDDSPDYNSRKKSKPKKASFAASTQPSRRMSTEDRMKEILERNRIESQDTLKDEPQEEYISMIKSSWDDAVGVRDSDASLYETLNKVNNASKQAPASIGGYGSTYNSEMSPLSEKDDSFNLSAADFEVGTIAARKSQDKLLSRNRRASLDVSPVREPSNPVLSVNVDESPRRDNRDSRFTPAGGKRYERVRDGKSASGINDPRTQSYQSTHDDVPSGFPSDSRVSGYSDGNFDSTRSSVGFSADNYEDAVGVRKHGFSARRGSDSGSGSDEAAAGGADDSDNYSDEFSEDGESPEKKKGPKGAGKQGSDAPTGDTVTSFTPLGETQETSVAASINTRRGSVADIMKRWQSPNPVTESTLPGLQAAAAKEKEEKEERERSAQNSANNSARTSPVTAVEGVTDDPPSRSGSSNNVADLEDNGTGIALKVSAVEGDIPKVSSSNSLSQTVPVGSRAPTPVPVVDKPPQHPSNAVRSSAPSGGLGGVFASVSPAGSRSASPGLGATDSEPTGTGGATEQPRGEVGISYNSFTSNNSDIVNITNGDNSANNYSDSAIGSNNISTQDPGGEGFLSMVGDESVNTSVAPPPPPYTSDAVYENSAETVRPIVPISAVLSNGYRSASDLMREAETGADDDNVAALDNTGDYADDYEPESYDNRDNDNGNDIDMTSGSEFIKKITQLTSAMDTHTSSNDKIYSNVSANRVGSSPNRTVITYGQGNRGRGGNHEDSSASNTSSSGNPARSHVPNMNTISPQRNYQSDTDARPRGTGASQRSTGRGATRGGADSGLIEFSKPIPVLSSAHSEGLQADAGRLSATNIPMMVPSVDELEAYMDLLETAQRTYHPRNVGPEQKRGRSLSASSGPRSRDNGANMSASRGTPIASVRNSGTSHPTARTARSRSNSAGSASGVRGSSAPPTRQSAKVMLGAGHPGKGSIDVTDALNEQIQVTESLTKQFKELTSEMNSFKTQQVQQQHQASEVLVERLVVKNESNRQQLGDMKSKLTSLKKKAGTGTPVSAARVRANAHAKRSTQASSSANSIGGVECAEVVQQNAALVEQAASAHHLHTEQQVLSSFKDMIERSVAIEQKDKRLREWEEALDIRESLLLVSNVNRGGSVRNSTDFNAPPPPPPLSPPPPSTSTTTGDRAQMITLELHNSQMEEKCREIEALKSELFEWRSGILCLEPPAYSAPVPDGDDEVPPPAPEEDAADVDEESKPAQIEPSTECENEKDTPASSTPVAEIVGERSVTGETRRVVVSQAGTLEAKLRQFLESHSATFEVADKASNYRRSVTKKTTVSLSKAEFDDVVSEVVQLERLISGYQHENEKLIVGMKETEAAAASIKASFFDQQEEMNRVLNQLKNEKGLNEITTTTGMNIHKSAEALRAELDREGELRQQVIEVQAEANAREKEFQLTINKLRADNKNLASQVGNIPLDIVTSEVAVTRALEAERTKHDREVDSLNKKLAWYAENQELLDKSATELAELRALVTICKRELKNAGTVEWKTIKQEASVARGDVLLDSSAFAAADAEEDAASDNELDCSTSMLPMETVAKGKTKGRFGPSATGTGSASSDATGKKKGVSGGTSLMQMKRSPADIKRIKELEGALKDLQETIRKRHPDSIPALIHAAQLTDSAVEERRQMEQTVADLRTENKSLKEEHALKMRSMKQELERLKTSMQEAVKRKQATVDSTPPGGSGASKKGASGATTTSGAAHMIKTLPQAQAKLKELDTELERTRAFYKRKVDELVRKHENQMKALKRGGGVIEAAEEEARENGDSEVVDAADALGTATNLDPNMTEYPAGVTVTAPAAVALTPETKAVVTAEVDALRVEVEGLQRECEVAKAACVALEKEKEVMVGLLRGTEPSSPNPTPAPATNTGDVQALAEALKLLEDYKTRFAALQADFSAYKAVQHSHAAVANSTAAVQSDSHNRDRQVLEAKEAECRALQKQVHEQELRGVELRNDLQNALGKAGQLQFELDHAKAQPQSPSQSQLSVSRSSSVCARFHRFLSSSLLVYS